MSKMTKKDHSASGCLSQGILWCLKVSWSLPKHACPDTSPCKRVTSTLLAPGCFGSGQDGCILSFHHDFKRWDEASLPSVGGARKNWNLSLSYSHQIQIQGCHWAFYVLWIFSLLQVASCKWWHFLPCTVQLRCSLGEGHLLYIQSERWVSL